MTTQKHKKILIAPLDWGMGHTTRCIPIINHLYDCGHHVVFAGNDWQRSFITETLPDIETTHLDGYNVQYNATGSFLAAILSQAPAILKTIKAEQQWLLQYCKQNHIGGVISDNRYGLHHPFTPSVIMTHQLQILTGMGAVSNTILKKLHYKYLSNFSEVWAPDTAGTPNLSGKLAHPTSLPNNTHYLGLLSQLTTDNIQASKENQTLLILLSGPEPQRTILSDILWEQVQNHKGKIIFVEGSKNATPRNAPLSEPALSNGRRGEGRGEVPRNVPVEVHTRLTATQLLPLLQQANMVICRSGYSTLMDLVALNKKAILIPTPGQTEQEYLGKHLHKQGVFQTAPQKTFNLQAQLKKATTFPFNNTGLHNSFHQHKEVINTWLQKL